jgi:ABC-type transporter Mla MlaB component
VVFSFFKKDPKDPKERGSKRPEDARGSGPRPMGRPMPDPASRVSPAKLPSQRFATTENALPDRELARSLAMETAAKIDKIESEMARDFLRPPGSGGAGATSSTPGAERAGSQEKPASLNGSAASVEDLDGAHDDFLGSVNAIEINTSGAGSVVDESAILFANGQESAAEQVLRAGLATDDLGHATQNAWLMLFELLNQRGDRAEFDQLTTQFALRFNGSSPTWVEYTSASEARTRQAAAPSASVSADGSPTVRLPVSVDANVIKTLEQLKSLATSHASLRLDASITRSVDLVGAELMLRVVTAFKRASHELTIVGAEQLINPLRAVIEPGRRDASDAGWMLLLEILRLLGRQHEFEETGIQYCITFEVSPPQWEPPPPNLKASAAVAGASAEPLAEPVSDGPLTWRGVIEAEGEPWFGRLAAEAKTTRDLQIDAMQLRRMAFSAASALLTLVMKLQQGGATVEFRNVNPLVGALFQLLGITAVSAVHLRRS